MYTVNIVSLHIDIRDQLDGMTRAVFTTRAVVMDIAEQILSGYDVITPTHVDESLYSRRRPWEKTSDIRTLEALYADAAPKIAEVLEPYRDTEGYFDCIVISKGGNLVIVPRDCILTWEYHHGTEYARNNTLRN